MTIAAAVAQQSTTTRHPLAVRRFDPRKEGLERWLGELETSLMHLFWAAGDGELTVREVLQRYVRDVRASTAHTTIMTTLARMAETGLLSRRETRAGTRRYIYRANVVDAYELERRYTWDVLTALGFGDREADELLRQLALD